MPFQFAHMEGCLMVLHRSAGIRVQRPLRADHACRAGRCPRVCKGHFLRIADLGPQRSMWAADREGLNGRFCLSDMQLSQVQLTAVLRP